MLPFMKRLFPGCSCCYSVDVMIMMFSVRENAECLGTVWCCEVMLGLNPLFARGKRARSQGTGHLLRKLGSGPALAQTDNAFDSIFKRLLSHKNDFSNPMAIFP